MSIKSIEDAKVLKKYCEHLGRAGVAKRIIEIAEEIAEHPSDPVGALRNAGKIRALTTGCGWDSYWDEKQGLGRQDMFWEAHNYLARLVL